MSFLWNAVKSLFGGSSGSGKYYCSTCGSENPSATCQKCYANRIAREREERDRDHERQEQKVQEGRAKAEHEYQLKLEKQKKENNLALEAQRRETEFKLAKEKHENELELEAKHNEYEKLKRDHEKELEKSRLDDINSTIKLYENDIAHWEKELKLTQDNSEKLMKSQNELEIKLKKYSKELEDTIKEQESADQLKRKELKLDEYIIELKRCDDEINGAINKTCVSEENVGRLLRLTKYLTQSTLNNQAHIARLQYIMNTFGDIIERDGGGDLSIKYYFGDKHMDRFIKAFENEDMYNMQDIICDDDDEYDELQEMLLGQLMSLENNNNDNNNNEKKEWDDMSQDEKKAFSKKALSFKEKKFLKKVCRKPESWKDIALQKQEALKERLIASSPVYCLFFEKIHKSMEQSNSMIQLFSELDATQNKTLAMIKGGKKKNNKNNDDFYESSVRSQMNNRSELECKDNKEENKEDENLMATLNNLDINSKTKLENSVLLRDFAINNINVIESLSNEIDNMDEKGRGTFCGVAGSVEHTCRQILEAQANVSLSILLSQAISQLKPSNLSNEAKQLWSAVDNGIISIYKTALKFSKVSSEYFSYFFKFHQSFAYFLSTQDKLLMVSTEHLKTDIKNFNNFSIEFSKIVDSLSKNAMDCIENCVKNSSGAKQFEDTRKKRDITKNDYLNAQKLYNEFIEKMNDEHNQKLSAKTTVENEFETNKLLLNSLNEQEKHQKSMLQTAVELRNQVIKKKTFLKDKVLQNDDNNNNNNNNSIALYRGD